MLYNIKAKVFATKVGKDFGRTVYVTVVANNKDQAFNEANKSFKNYCAKLEKNHNNTFDYTDLIVE